MNKYKKYDDSIKEMIIKSGDPNLFPELNIPRTTALYWLRQSKRKIKLTSSEPNIELKRKIEKLEEELKQEKAKSLFLSSLLKRIIKSQNVFKKTEDKEFFVDQVTKVSKYHPIKSLCRIAGIRVRKFYNFKVQTKGCPRVGFKKCKILSPNQLSFVEQEIIYDLANDRSLSHLSIKGLQYHAFRKGLLSCGYDSWRKYVKEFRADIKKRVKNKRYHTGIRASSPNDLWHMDVTEFKLKDGKKAYLQVIVDNYSRKVINWELSLNKGQMLSIKNLKNSMKKSMPKMIMTDGGGENIGAMVKSILLGKGVESIIAKADIIFSNSMVESFFKVLKNKYLNKFKKYKFSKLFKQIMRSVECFNNTPLGLFHGVTPSELFLGSVNIESLKLKFDKEIKRGVEIRPLINKSCLRKASLCPEF